eukprot:scaffold327_cov257-Pinguiococcus_pyrenoidosus.AAC.49
MDTERAREVASSFQHEDFEPVWWAKNNNVMTIAGAGVVSDAWKKLTGAPAEPPFYDVRKQVLARDGAEIFVDFRAADRAAGGIHLQASSASPGAGAEGFSLWLMSQDGKGSTWLSCYMV